MRLTDNPSQIAGLARRVKSSVAITIGSTGVTIFCSGADTICADTAGAISATTSPNSIAHIFMTPLC